MFLAKNPTLITHSIQVILIRCYIIASFSTEFERHNNYFDVQKQIIKKYEVKEISKIYFITEEQPWDLTEQDITDMESHNIDFRQKVTFVMKARRHVFNKSVTLSFSTYNANDVMDDGNFVLALDENVM